MSEPERQRADESKNDRPPPSPFKRPSLSQPQPSPSKRRSLMKSESEMSQCTPPDEGTPSESLEEAQSSSREPATRLHTTSLKSTPMQERQSLEPSRTSPDKKSNQQKTSWSSIVKERLHLTKKKPSSPPGKSSPTASASGTQPRESTKPITRDLVSQAVSRTMEALGTPLLHQKKDSPTKHQYTQTRGGDTVDPIRAAEKAARRAHLLPTKKPQKYEIVLDFDEPRRLSSDSNEQTGVKDKASQTNFPGELQCVLKAAESTDSGITDSTYVDLSLSSGRRPSTSDELEVLPSDSSTLARSHDTLESVVSISAAQLDSSREECARPSVGSVSATQHISTEKGTPAPTRSLVPAPPVHPSDISPEEGIDELHLAPK